MNCRDLETELTPYLDGELVAEAKVEVEAHLATCTVCAKHVEVERHNLSLIKEAVRTASPAAPEALKARLFESVRRDDRHRRQVRVARVSAAAAGVAIAVLAGNHAWRVHQLRLYEQDAAFRHARQFPLEINQPQAEAIEQWFGGKLDHRVSLPRFPNATASGARLLQVRDKPAAYIRYDAPRQMGLFVYGDDNDVDVGAEPAVGNSHGYNVVSWREGDLVYQLVTDLDEADVRELVQHPDHATDQGAPLHAAPRLEVRPASLQH